jgi:hypothetical protein
VDVESEIEQTCYRCHSVVCLVDPSQGGLTRKMRSASEI